MRVGHAIGNRSYWHHGSWPDDPPPLDGAHACARTGSSAPASTRVQATSHPPYCVLARAALGHTDDDGQDVVCETGLRQTAMDDTHVATWRHRVVDAPG